MSLQKATVVTILTSPGRGAVATVSISGPQAVELVQRWFQSASGKPVADVPLRRIAFGRWNSGDGPGEELVVCRLAEDLVEIQCHGGAAAVEAIVSSLESSCAKRQSPQECLVAGTPNLIAAEARVALAEAKTERTAFILLDQYHGALRREVEAIIACFADGEPAHAQAKLRHLSQLRQIGQHLTTPWQIAIVGPPNVGKSSLMNALVGYSRSIVCDEPGTTRDLVRAETAFDGWPIELVDTAGLRQTKDAIESAGVQRAEEFMATADLCLRVTDATEPMTSRQYTEFPPTANVQEMAIANKVDLIFSPGCLAWPDLKVSAKTGQGLPELMATIVVRLVGPSPDPGEAIPFTSRHCAIIDEAQQAAELRDYARAVTALQRF